MNKVVPWDQLCALIEPYYPVPGNGRPPVGLERMLRIYFLQHWFNLSDPGAEKALYEYRSMCRFAGIDLGREPVPDESTILNFRHLLEQHQLGDALFQAVGVYQQAHCRRIAGGAIVDPSIISAPSPTRNQDKARDPDMHQTRKGNQWYFGMRTHIGVNSKIKQIHSISVTAANVHSQVLDGLLHRDETRVWDDSACTKQYEERKHTKSRVRAKVEHVFAVIKRVFGFTRVRYRGLAKNTHALFVLCALTNLYMARRGLRCPTLEWRVQRSRYSTMKQ